MKTTPKTTPKVTHAGAAILQDGEVNLAVLSNKKRLIAASSGSSDSIISQVPKFAEVLSMSLDKHTATINKALVDNYVVRYIDMDGKEKEGYDISVIVDIADNCIQYGNRLREQGRQIPAEAKPVLDFSRELMLRLAMVGMNALIDEAAAPRKARITR